MPSAGDRTCGLLFLSFPSWTLLRHNNLKFQRGLGEREREKRFLFSFFLPRKLLDFATFLTSVELKKKASSASWTPFLRSTVDAKFVGEKEREREDRAQSIIQVQQPWDANCTFVQQHKHYIAQSRSRRQIMLQSKKQEKDFSLYFFFLLPSFLFITLSTKL